MVQVISILLGLATHAIFHFFEPRRPLVPVTCTLFVLPLCGLGYGARISATAAISAYTAYLFTLCVSIVLYRLSPLHPLAQYPGPRLFKITKLAGVWASYSGRHHLILKALHDKYGPVVRIGPNDLSVVDADAVTVVLGSNGLPKGRYYDGRRDPSAPMNLVSMEPGEVHTRRRRLWSRGLSSESLKDYEDIIAERARELVDGLERHSSGVVDIVEWINFFTFDFMGYMAFGQGYGMLHVGADEASYWPVIENFAQSAAMVCHVPWAMPLVQKLPFVAKDLLKMRKLGVDSATARMNRGSKSKDLYYHLADEAGYETQKPNVREVVADGALAIIAGADTTSSAMSSLLYFLMRDHERMRRLQEEIDHVYPDTNHVLDSSKHNELKYLNACINEALRLHPPVPTGGPREVREGTGVRIIAGHPVPEQTQIYIPSYVLHRDPRYYPDAPDAFKPERWLDDRETLNSTAFIPFSFGPANCIGRHLARREMLMVMSLLLRKFELRFAEGFDVEAWPGTLYDYFVSARGPLLVRLQGR